MGQPFGNRRRNQISHRPGLRWVAALALLLVLAASLYATKKNKTSAAADEQKRVLHALNRLTFGPRPGDVQAVAAMGVDKWIDLQLHPEKIDDSAMQARLAAYRTLTMSSGEMLLEFPPNPVAKAVMDGKLPMPRDPYRRAIYTAAIDRIEQQQIRKQNEAGSKANAGVIQTSSVSPNKPANTEEQSPRPQERRYAHRVADELALLPPNARMQRILSLPVAEQRDLTQGIPFGKRQALLAGLTPEQRETMLALNNPVAVINAEVQSSKLLRAVYCDRQLEEVLTDFWFNHFNVFIGKGADHYLITSYERDVIRPHALGKFKDLLVATAKSPAMMYYLDNFLSVGPDSAQALGLPAHPSREQLRYPPRPNPNKRRSGLNENYGRELLELHTLSVNGGYSQRDVTETA